jgi:hypothetical protein
MTDEIPKPNELITETVYGPAIMSREPPARHDVIWIDTTDFSQRKWDGNAWVQLCAAPANVLVEKRDPATP